ncbi:hypothetical protein [uncultured Paludibaculum sp.]|uniref:hypothetical protein n=1 Tax=uncultured Paludibaculum sp. TaxID=1765020 RepID=UPI002AAB9E1A|nr:hypothetical protein [uncultured Paludibaculum sp.]
MKRLLLFALLALPTIGISNQAKRSDPIPSCYPFCPSVVESAPVAVAPTSNVR